MSTNAGNTVSITLPSEITKDIVNAQIKAAVVTALAKDPEKLVAAVVDAAMKQKPERGYSSDPPIWDTMLNNMIREAAQDAFKEWLSDNSAMITRKVRERLTREKSQFIEKIVDSLVSAAKSSFYFTVNIKELDR
jgi:hypothetical protein